MRGQNSSFASNPLFGTRNATKLSKSDFQTEKIIATPIPLTTKQKIDEFRLTNSPLGYTNAQQVNPGEIITLALDEHWLKHLEHEATDPWSGDQNLFEQTRELLKISKQKAFLDVEVAKVDYSEKNHRYYVKAKEFKGELEIYDFYSMAYKK